MKDEKLSNKLLGKYGFNNITDNKFESYPLHPYWVKDGVVLFYNLAQEEYSYLCGYAEMRMGKYYAVGCRWINYESELKDFYKVLTGNELTK